MPTFRPVLLAGAALALACSSSTEPKPPENEVIPSPALHTPRWAFEPWISKDISTGEDTRAFVQGFRDRDIPVGVVVLDSPWETHYNTFVPNPARYPDFGKMVADLRAQDVRTVLWVTQMINKSGLDLEPGGDVYEGSSPNYEEAIEKGYCVNKGALYLWWKGEGCGLDFFNPAAVKWWHAQQDALLAMGVAGWKLDFGEEYISTPAIETAQGPVTKQQYSEEYYRDYLAYGVHKRGAEEFVTMVRPWDESYGFPGRFFAKPEHAPVAWVGDNRRDWKGLADALDEMLRSAAAGYSVVGSDIGGYLDRDDVEITEKIPFSVDVFQRWTAVGAVGPFMQLHGRANITPWTVPERADETVAAYRYWSKVHHELVPFFFSQAQEAAAGRGRMITPVGTQAEWANDYRFVVGDALLVAPLLDASGKRDVTLPEGSRWYDWWRPVDGPLEGGTRLVRVDVAQAVSEVPSTTRIPLYVKEGAIIPVAGATLASGLGLGARNDLTLHVYPSAQATQRVVHETDGKTTTVEAKGDAITLSRSLGITLLRVRSESKPGGVSLDGAALSESTNASALDGAQSGWLYDEAQRAAWVKLPAANARRTVNLSR